MPSVSDDRGAVTAELMLVMPTLVIGVGILGALVSVSLERISLERETAAALREISIGRELVLPPGVSSRNWMEGRLICLEFIRTDWLPISAKHCALPLA